MAGTLDESAFQVHSTICAEVGDIRAIHAAKAPLGRIVQDHEYISDAEMRHHPYWQELLIPLGLQYAAMVSCNIESDGPKPMGFGFSLQRTPRQGPLTGENLGKYQALVPHLERCVRIFRRFGSTASSSNAPENPAPMPAVFQLDSQGRVVSMNQVADDHLASSRLRIASSGTLSTGSPAADSMLERAIHGTLLRQRSAPTDGTLNGPSVRWTYVLAPIPASALDHLADCSTRVAVELRLTQRTSPVVVNALTPAEQRIALALCRGWSLRRAAMDAGVAYETARNQLKSAMHKLGVSSQSALVSMMLRDRVVDRSLE